MGLSWQHLLVVLLIALLIFGTKKLRNIGSDMGAAVRGFKKAMNEDDEKDGKPQKAIRHDDSDDADFDTDTKKTRSGRDENA